MECTICGGTGIRVVPVAYEDDHGIVQHDEKRIVCDGCSGRGEWELCAHCEGTGQRLWRPPEQAGGVGEECVCEWCGGSGYTA